MAFKSVDDFNEERYRYKFRLVDDGESADVIFLYRSKRDMMHADVHYVKTDNYSGYVHCLGHGCPVCARKKSDGTQLIRVQEKLFIPVYNIAKDQIEFWDRAWNNGFIAQLDRDIFNIYDNPSEYVFKITRKGAFNEQSTRYTFTAIGTNAVMSYEQILAKFNTTMAEYYENIVKSYSFAELASMMQTQQITPATPDIPAYVPIPRAGYQSSIPDTFVNATDVISNTSIDEINSDPILNQFDDESDEGDEFPDPNF